MNSIFDVQDGDKVELFFSLKKRGIFKVFGKADDELILINTEDELNSFPGKEIVIAQTVNIKGIKVNIGDKVTVLTKNGKMKDMYVNCLFGGNGISLSPKKESSTSALSWLFKLMSRL